MLAYDKTIITNSAVVKRAKKWYSQKLLSDAQMNVILNKYKTNIYSFNVFIKIGLFLFTNFAISSALGLITLFFAALARDNEKGFELFICIFSAIGCFTGLELFIKGKRVFHSGIDNAFLYAAFGFLISFLSISIDNNNGLEIFFLLLFVLLLPFAIAAVLRYSDVLMTAFTLFLTYSILFLSVLKIGSVAKLIMPFVLMIASAILYYVLNKLLKRRASFFYTDCIAIARCIALLVFYAAGNYFVIRESSISFFDLQLAEGQDIPLAIFFYLFTALVPVAYIYYALKSKDKLLLGVGLVLIALAALTFKNYFSLGHPEIALTAAGMVMMVFAYLSIRYLKTHTLHITFNAEPDEDNFMKSNIEAMVIAQSFTQQTPVQDSATPNAGGDFGGAGSGGNY